MFIRLIELKKMGKPTLAVCKTLIILQEHRLHPRLNLMSHEILQPLHNYKIKIQNEQPL